MPSPTGRPWWSSRIKTTTCSGCFRSGRSTSRFLLSAYPAAPVFEDLVGEPAAPQFTYRRRWTPIWRSVDDDIWADVFTDRCKRAPIVSVATIKAHLRPFFVPPIRRVITHNNWGEYGHTQHRMVNIAVRELAVEAGLDVWALGTRIAFEAREQSQYVDVAATLGLPTIEGYFDPEPFREVRAALSGPTAYRVHAQAHGQVPGLVAEPVDLAGRARGLSHGLASVREARGQGHRSHHGERRREEAGERDAGRQRLPRGSGVSTALSLRGRPTFVARPWDAGTAADQARFVSALRLW